jgi:hypothetical protein
MDGNSSRQRAHVSAIRRASTVAQTVISSVIRGRRAIVDDDGTDGSAAAPGRRGGARAVIGLGAPRVPGTSFSLQVFLCNTELETSMHRSFFLLTIAALTGFATAVHAHDGAPHAGPMNLAKLDGQGNLAAPCHATYRDKVIPQGFYQLDTNNAELVCRGGGDQIPCHVYDTLGPPIESLCVDGW